MGRNGAESYFSVVGSCAGSLAATFMLGKQNNMCSSFHLISNKSLQELLGVKGNPAPHEMSSAWSYKLDYFIALAIFLVIHSTVYSF